MDGQQDGETGFVAKQTDAHQRVARQIKRPVCLVEQPGPKKLRPPAAGGYDREIDGGMGIQVLPRGIGVRGDRDAQGRVALDQMLE